jgi:lipopolysaccharide transport system permease protein
MGLLALGLGMIISAMTAKYKDLIHLLGFGMQLFMFATPIIYPLSRLPERYRIFVMANPMSPIVETFRYAFTGTGTFSWLYLGYSLSVTLLILCIGTIVFNKVEKAFTDTV